MNDYEQLIEMMFADGTLEQSVRQEIEGMNDLQKRLHIVKILDKGLGLFTKIEGIMNLGKMDYIKEVVKVLKDYVLIADVEKEKFGEVMTPLILIKDMLSVLSKDVWSNPNLKWLDSCNGTGPYPIMVIYKLMVGLKDWETNDEKRYKHIINNMIYVGEIQPKNMFLYMNAVDPMNEYNLNIYTGSFLEKEFDIQMSNVWNVSKFDIVIGNPPYNQMIDMLFLQKSYKISDIVLYVHPSTWLLDEKGKQKKFNETKELIKNDLESIKLFNGNGIFAISLFVPCVITYVNKYKKTNVIKCNDLINEVEIYYNSIFEVNKFSNSFIYPNLVKKIKSKIKYSLLDRLNDNNDNFIYFINIPQIRGDVKNRDKRDTGMNEKMISDNFYTLSTKSLDVEYSSRQQSFIFETIEESINFLNYTKTYFARFCLSIYKNNQNLHRGELSIIPFMDFKREWTDLNLIKYYNLDDNEVEFIMKNIPKYY
jgi:hypothetical protein